MATKEKESNAWIIGIGYILVAAILLLSYLSQKPDKMPQTGIRGPENPETEVLKAQLEQERAKNREMSEMINNMQEAIKVGGAYSASIATINNASGTFSAFSVEDVLEKGLPKIEDVATFQEKIYPQESRLAKNPFVPFYDPDTIPEISAGKAMNSRAPKIPAHPFIPLPLKNTWNAPIVVGSYQPTQARY